MHMCTCTHTLTREPMRVLVNRNRPVSTVGLERPNTDQVSITPSFKPQSPLISGPSNQPLSFHVCCHDLPWVQWHLRASYKRWMAWCHSPAQTPLFLPIISRVNTGHLLFSQTLCHHIPSQHAVSLFNGTFCSSSCSLFITCLCLNRKASPVQGLGLSPRLPYLWQPTHHGHQWFSSEELIR